MRNKLTFMKVLGAIVLSIFAIDMYGQITIYSQDFSGTYPWGMSTNSLNGAPYVWTSSNSSALRPSDGSGTFAVANSDATCELEWDSELVTPSLDFSQYENVQLNFASYFEEFLGLSEYYVEVSINNGNSWIVEESGSLYHDDIIHVDLSAYDGYPNVKIRWRYMDIFGCSYYWAIDNIEVLGDLLPACTAPPIAGTAVSSAPSVCSEVVLSLSGASLGTGMAYQWQSSPDGIVWTDIPGATSAGTIQNISTPTVFRAILTCSGQSDTSTAVSVGISNFLSCYCMPNFTDDCSEDYTANVKFGTINNSSFCGGSVPNNFSDYTNISTTVVKGNTYQLSVTTDGDDDGVGVWIDFDHSGTFDASELVLNGYTGTVPATYTANVLIPATALDGPTIMRVINRYSGTVNANQACATFAYGEVEHYTVNIIQPATDEAGVLEITSPGTSACSLGNEIWVKLQNLGTNPLTSVNFTLKVNNVPLMVTNPWTGNIAPGTSMEVQVPASYSFADGDSVSVEVSLPNGLAEDSAYAFNNHVGRRLFTGLSGNKTVYGPSADYSDLNVAIDDLVRRGVCDTVYFKIATGTYNTRHDFVPYTGATAGKLAVFESASGNAADVVFNFSTTAGNNSVFNFNGGSFYSLRNITAIASGTTYAGVIRFTNNSHDIELANNIFIGDTAATYQASNFNKIIVTSDYSTGPDYDNLWIHGNKLLGGTRSFDMEVDDGEYQSGIVIENNELSKFSVLGILTYNTSNLVFRNNKIAPRTGITGEMYGVYPIVNIGGGDISGNDIYIPGRGVGIFLEDVVGGTSSFKVSNNFVYILDSTSNNLSVGIGTVGAINNVLVANNSIALNSDNTGIGGILIESGSSISVVNNNIVSYGDAPALNIVNGNNVDQVANNNLFGSLLANIGGTIYNNIGAFQASAYGAGSLSVNPNFNGTDLHTCAVELNAAGIPLPAITHDIDGDVRSSTPDIGADEFLGDANDLLAQDNFLKCPDDQVTIGNTALNGVTYAWAPSGNTSEITVSAEGTYVITATSSCGTFSDTAVVVNKPLPDAAFTSTSVGLAGIFNNTSTNGTGYSWDFGDGNTSTDMNPTHVYAAAGTYSVTLTVTNDCGSDTFGPSPVNVINAGIEENSLMEVSLFPNPTNGKFTITLTGVNGTETNISVIDMTGKTLMQENLAAGGTQITLDATSFAPGVYSIKVSAGEFAKVVRLVKN